MTDEQWIIYFYGIYPNGRLLVIFIILTGLLVVIALISYMIYREDLGYAYKRKNILQEYEDSTLLFQKLYKPTKIVGGITIALMVIMSLLPSKDVFLALVATPTVIESFQKEGGKLNRVNSIIDKVLEKTERVLEDEDNKIKGIK